MVKVVGDGKAEKRQEAEMEPKNGSSVRSERHIQGCKRGENRMMGFFK